MNTRALHKYIQMRAHTHAHTHLPMQEEYMRAHTRVLLPVHGLGMSALTYGRTHSGIWAETRRIPVHKCLCMYIYTRLTDACICGTAARRRKNINNALLLAVRVSKGPREQRHRARRPPSTLSHDHQVGASLLHRFTSSLLPRVERCVSEM